MKLIRTLFTLAILGVVGVLAFVYSGIYPIGADVPHSKATHWLLETLRDRATERASENIVVPNLDDPQMLASGGADYNEMCSGCHLKPGREQSEIRQGLYPQPPNLAKGGDDHGDDAREAAKRFWIIKHGIKASAMPAWGLTHDDARIWAMVAFIRRLPELTPDQYQILTAREEGASEAHEHGGITRPPAANNATPAADSMADAEPAKVVERFQQALSSGDTATALSLLDENVRIFESGGIERSREEYASHHLAADAGFLRGATIRQLSRTGDEAGDLAWGGSESQISAPSSGKPAKLGSTETMILKKGDNGWRIVHIHWSSRTLEPDA